MNESPSPPALVPVILFILIRLMLLTVKTKCFPKNGFILNDEDLEELLPRYPQTLTRPLQIRATLPQDNFLLRSREKRQTKPKESKSKVSNFYGLKGRQSKNNASQFTNPNNIWPESEDRFFEMKSSPLLQFFDR
ncbi:hypothetical protein ACTXT7_013857 [Hymenolepis weldensis]